MPSVWFFAVFRGLDMRRLRALVSRAKRICREEDVQESGPPGLAVAVRIAMEELQTGPCGDVGHPERRQASCLLAPDDALIRMLRTHFGELTAFPVQPRKVARNQLGSSLFSVAWEVVSIGRT